MLLIRPLVSLRKRQTQLESKCSRKRWSASLAALSQCEAIVITLFLLSLISSINCELNQRQSRNFEGKFNDVDNYDDSKSLERTKRKQREVDLESLLSEGEEKCINKRCVQSEQCCPGSVCVDVDGVAGNCLPIYGVNEGESCRDDNDCEPGLRCLDNQPNQAVSQALREKPRTCQPPGRDMMKKQYNDECSTSSECDASHGLCCQLTKRHRMAPRRLCYYFSDPKSCIGPVDVTFARPSPVVNPAVNNAFFKARIG